jgi:hypothetical protein
VIGHSALGQQSEADRLLADEDKLAWLKNWQAAEPFFRRQKSCSNNAATSKRVVCPDQPHAKPVTKQRAFRDLNLSGVRTGRPPHKG